MITWDLIRLEPTWVRALQVIHENWNGISSPTVVDYQIFTHHLRARDRQAIKKSSHSPPNIYFRNIRSHFIDRNGFDKLLPLKLFVIFRNSSDDSYPARLGSAHREQFELGWAALWCWNLLDQQIPHQDRRSRRQRMDTWSFKRNLD